MTMHTDLLRPATYFLQRSISSDTGTVPGGLSAVNELFHFN